jgi:CheY-like chemotaxis protein
MRCPLSVTIEDHQLMFGEDGLRYNRTDAAWPRKSSKSNDEMHENDDKIPHLGHRIKRAKCLDFRPIFIIRHVQAEDGVQGVEIFRTWQPHLIWMDIRLPVMGGVEAAGKIRLLEGGREVKIVALSASAFAHEREGVLAAGLNDFLRKPFRRGEIFDVMARQLGVRYQYREVSRAFPADSVAALRQEALATLPEQLRKELADALVRLDPGPIWAVIDRVAEQDAQLGEMIARYAKRFEYTQILNALEETQWRSGRARP